MGQDCGGRDRSLSQFAASESDAARSRRDALPQNIVCAIATDTFLGSVPPRRGGQLGGSQVRERPVGDDIVAFSGERVALGGLRLESCETARCVMN